MSTHPSLEIFDLNMRRVAVMTTSSNNVETEKLNGISDFKFQVPKSDTKIAYVKKRNTVRYDNGEAYRIIDLLDVKNATGYKQASCEHVLATLADDVMFQDHVVGNSGQDTEYVINYILSHQTVRRWVLRRCDFHYFYEYGWSSENLLNALFSVVKPFTDQYKFETNTSVYPYELSLIRLDTTAKPDFYIFERLNFLEEQRKEESGEVFTRLYGLGAGEGVNQVTISEVNNGIPYLDAPQSAINEHGLISGVFSAREYDSPQMLKDVMDAMIAEVCQPYITYDVKVVDLHEINGRPLLDAKTGKIIQCSDGYRTYISEITRNYDVAGDMSMKLANKAKDVSDNLASLADRQRIEATYSQGATQLWANTTVDNASPTDGLVHPIWMPKDAKIVNSVMVKIEMARFRAYSKTTSSGGGSAQTSSASGGGSHTSSAGGGGTETSSSGGGQTTSVTQILDQGSTGSTSIGTSTYSTSERNSHTHNYVGPSGSHAHYYAWSGSHSHSISNHTHTVTIKSHSHSVSIGSHTHSVDIPSHTHSIEYGIFYAPGTPSSAMVYVNGTYAFSIGSSYEGDITEYLVGTDGKIPRGRYIDLKVVPNALGRITISSAPQAFIQSKTGGNY